MRGPRRKISAGTVLVLLSTILILGGTGYVLSRIGTGAPIDLSRLQPETVNLQETPVPLPEETPAAATAVPDLPARTPAPSAEPAAAERSFTLTVAGTVCLSGEVRKNSYFSDVKQYDYIGVPYPEGNMGDEYQYLFNHEDVTQVFFLGVEDVERQQFIRGMAEFYKEHPEEKPIKKV